MSGGRVGLSHSRIQHVLKRLDPKFQGSSSNGLEVTAVSNPVTLVVLHALIWKDQWRCKVLRFLESHEPIRGFT